MYMQVVILAGGLGSRLAEETDLKPKPMVEIGGRPILWHIMKIYSSYGLNDFIICCGYKGYVIKEYFANYFLHMSDVTFDMNSNTMEVHHKHAEPWRVTLVDTGEQTLTGGRLKRVEDYIQDEPFCFTYGDGVSDINIGELIRFHKEHKKTATITAVQPPGRYGSLQIDPSGSVTEFNEKPYGDGAWINGGFFVLNKDIFQYIDGDMTSFERGPLEKMVRDKKIAAFKHSGFWQAMDTLREKNLLLDLWNSGNAPWKVW